MTDGRGLAVSNYVVANNTRNLFRDRNSNPASGAVGAFFRDSSTNLRDLTDGSSNTIIAGERAWRLGSTDVFAASMYAVRDFNAGGPANGNQDANQGMVACAAAVTHPINTIPSSTSQRQTFSSRHTGGAHVLLGDGAVRFISENINHNTTDAIDSTLERLIAIGDGQTVGDF